MAHLHEKIDWTVDVFIVQGDAVLLRKHDKYKRWLVPGGHIELDEEPTQAALREVREEVGMEVKLVGEIPPIGEEGEYEELLAPRFMNIHGVNENHKHISLVYFATAEDRETKQGEEEVSDELKWFTREELDNPSFGVSETIRHYARAALDELGS